MYQRCNQLLATLTLFLKICSKLLQALTNVIIKIKLNHANSENLDRITENTKKYGSLLKMKNHVNINVGRLITLNSGTSNTRKIPGPKNATWDVALQYIQFDYMGYYFIKDIVRAIYHLEKAIPINNPVFDLRDNRTRQ